MRQARAFAVAMMAALTFAVFAPPAGAEEVSSSQYLAVLRGARAMAPGDSADLQIVRSVTAVREPDGTVVRVDNSWMAADDRTLPAQLEMAISQAEAAQRGGSTIQSGSPSDAAREITGAPEFHPRKTLVARIRDAIRDALRSAIPQARPAAPNLPNAPSAPSGVVQLVVYLVLALVLAIVLYLIWRALRGRVRDEEDKRSDGEDVWGIGPANPTTLQKMAAEAASEGRFSDAVRALYLANLLLLDKRGAIHFDPAFTNGEFGRRLARAYAATALPFGSATLTFERVHYGGDEATSPDWEESKAEWDQVWTGIG